MPKATIKDEGELRGSCLTETEDGFHFRGQFFPKVNLKFCGLEIEATQWIGAPVFEALINDTWHFFPAGSLKVEPQKL